MRDRIGNMSPSKLLKKLLKVVINATLTTSISFSVPWGGEGEGGGDCNQK